MNKLTPDIEQSIDTREASDLVGLSVSTLTKMRMTGDGPPYYVVGKRRVVYKPSECAAWRDADRRRSTSEEAGSAQ